MLLGKVLIRELLTVYRLATSALDGESAAFQI